MQKKSRLFLVFLFCFFGTQADNSDLDSVLKLVDVLKDDSLKVARLLAISDSLDMASDYNNALIFAQRARLLAVRINYRQGIADAYHLSGNLFTSMFNNKQALENFQKALAINIALNNKKELVSIYGDMAWAYAKADYPEAIVNFKRALQIATEIKDTLKCARSHWGLSETYTAMGNYSEGLKSGYAALRLLESLGNTKMLIYLYSNLGYIFEKQNNYDEALTVYNKSLVLSQQMGEKIGIADANSNIGQLLFIKGDLDGAYKKYLIALNIFEEEKNYYRIALANDQLGSIQEKKGDAALLIQNTSKAKEYYNDALQLCMKALTIYDTIVYKLGSAGSYITVGNICLKLKNYTQAKKYLDRSLVISKSIDSKEFIKNAYKSLSHYYDLQNNYPLAYKNYKLYIDYRDSLNNEEVTRSTVRIQMQYEFDKKEAAVKAEQDKKDLITFQKAKRQRNIRNSTFVGLGGVLIFALVVYRQRNKIAHQKKRSDELLLNILPEDTAEELKNTGEAKTKSFELVTVLFTDFKNFTQASELLSAEDLVKEINYCFSTFDTIITKYGIEKIKTIGDSYMCAGGLPVINSHHPVSAVKAGLEMQQFIMQNKHDREKQNLPYFELRVGIHSGPVVAGVVGTKKFAYDIWGDTVNMASRMESSGETGKVNISGVTYNLVRENFQCNYRGKIDAKNKGQIDMYFVEKEI